MSLLECQSDVLFDQIWATSTDVILGSRMDFIQISELKNFAETCLSILRVRAVEAPTSKPEVYSGSKLP